MTDCGVPIRPLYTPADPDAIGVGQSDAAVAECSGCSVVVNVPGLGDQVWASQDA